MKKLIISLSMAVLLVAPVFAFATANSIDELISQLQVQIAALQAQINALVQQQSNNQWCHTFNKNLGIGSNSDEVGALRTALVREGFQNASSEGETQVFVSFDETLASVVSGFQEKYASDILTPNGLQHGTGYVGPSTRAKLNSLYGCNGNGQPTSISNPNTTNGLCPAGQTWSGPIDSGECVSIITTTITPVTLSAITPSSGPVATSVRLDGCGSDSSSGFTLVYIGPKSGSAAIPVETLGAASGCGFMTFTVPSDFPAGAYTLQVKNNQTGALSTNSVVFTVTAPVVSGGGSGSSAACTTSFSPNSIKIGDFTTWNFAAGAGDTTFQYSCNSGFTKADGTMPLSYGPLPLSGAWSIKVPGPLDCTLTSWNPNVTGSGSTCRASVAVTFFTITTASLPNASVNTSYSIALATTNAGTAPYQWSWSPAASGSGVLPAGLTLNSSTGVISGTPTTAGKYDVAIKVTDAAGTVATKTLTLYVDAQAGVSTQCTSSFSPNPAKVGDITTWSFAAGAGDTTFQYSCSAGITKEDGTTLLSYGSLPLSGTWRIKVSGPLDCTLDSYNPNVTGSGSQCRVILKGTVAESTDQNFASVLDSIRFQLDAIAAKIKAITP